MISSDKLCKECGATKKLHRFYRDSKSPDGHRSSCKSCVRERDHKRYLSNKPAIIARARKWEKANKQKCAERVTAYRKRIGREAVLVQRRGWRETARIKQQQPDLFEIPQPVEPDSMLPKETTQKRGAGI